jgi:dTDP-4-amino-4,6-dideoxygalactose transaminase
VDQPIKILATTIEMKIPFTNLYQQYMDCRSEIDTAIASTIQSSSFITGPDASKFESVLAKYVGSEDCAGTGSGTTALLCSLRAAGIGAGDEVITTPHTFVATTEAIVSVGAIPRFADIDPDTHLIDLDRVESMIGPRTRAILFVDIYGQCPDMDRLRKICDEYRVYMIEDAAHSLGTQWRNQHIGSIADLTCFSFNPVKNLGAMGDAGCVTGSARLMDAIRKYRDHGRLNRYDIIEVGYNARIDNIQSNIVLAKLPKLATWIDRKRQICAYYNERLHGVIKTIHLDPRVTQGHYVYVIQTAQRDQLKSFLENHDISTNIHYATTTHTQPAFISWYAPCPIAERTVNEILSLPCWYSMSDSEIDYVVDTVRKFFQ